MGNRAKRTEQPNSKRCLSIGEYTRESTEAQWSNGFLSLDAAGAYHAVVIEPDSRDCTAFISPFSTFHYIRIPFGLCNVYSKMLGQALSHLPR